MALFSMEKFETFHPFPRSFSIPTLLTFVLLSFYLPSCATSVWINFLSDSPNMIRVGSAKCITIYSRTVVLTYLSFHPCLIHNLQSVFLTSSSKQNIQMQNVKADLHYHCLYFDHIRNTARKNVK